ncbi:fumarylacetoacetate hydrolase family protein [Pararhodobacter zhoushanensis]|uniref:Fumarylacetoacetate hydrolase family protein n=1 Tax=Pararhodobacter zhoushanensis TaxID=2479545 RepID=A0ABT3GTT7_9RHOB|nr:fumarylacetoacetate hydrolase family protein [Pararhodobacter zhoushanensis]MCW1930959.1 fumarylacetoacetate hydrolase family protein [Pararhodobacter zhoushanensis]
MTQYLFTPAPVRSLKVLGQAAEYPVSRIFCVGRNYEAHAAEMGGTVDREAPWYFTKSAVSAVCLSGETRPYPPGTSDFHYEMELVVAVGDAVFKADLAQAEAAIFAYGCGLDMTRRDRQQDGKDNRRPWDLGKDVEGSAVLTTLTPAAGFALAGRRIHLEVNGTTRQDATLDDMVWSPAEVISHLSHYYHLQPGDIILTGTPAGVGPVVAGDAITGGIDGLEPISLTLGAAE